jgi:hypothetical protein
MGTWTRDTRHLSGHRQYRAAKTALELDHIRIHLIALSKKLWSISLIIIQGMVLTN